MKISRKDVSFFGLSLVLLLLLSGGCRTAPNPPSRTSNISTDNTSSSTTTDRGIIQKAWSAYRENDFESVIDILDSVDPGESPEEDVPMLLALSNYHLDNFEQSQRFWRMTMDRLNTASERDTARTYRRRTRKLSELNLTTHQYNNFRILVPEGLNKRTANHINHQLERAYQQVGGDFSYFPDDLISVILYRPGPFRRVIDAPIWSGGLFDGKIHLQYDQSRDDPVSKATLVHEYTHSVIHSLARDNVPLWFNEGLATYQEYRQTDEEFRYVRLPDQRPRSTIRTLDDINTMFRSDSSQNSSVRLGYEYSYALIQFMEERYGFRTLKTILKRTGETSSFETALLDTINTNEDRLQFAWESWVSNQF